MWAARGLWKLNKHLGVIDSILTAINQKPQSGGEIKNEWITEKELRVAEWWAWHDPIDVCVAYDKAITNTHIYLANIGS